jgi:hypothetical protein
MCSNTIGFDSLGTTHLQWVLRKVAVRLILISTIHALLCLFHDILQWLICSEDIHTVEQADRN